MCCGERDATQHGNDDRDCENPGFHYCSRPSDPSLTVFAALFATYAA
jgi:hypothetical protein